MSTLFQINVTANWGSTGKIAESIGTTALNQGWQSYLAYGRDCNPSQSQLIKVGSKFDVYAHYAEQRIFDNEGQASRGATKQFIRQIEEIRPDIVQLHNIHDHYLNYRILFEYLNKTTIQVVWTFHDCWAFTGHCFHFVTKDCQRWKTHCHHCPLHRESPNTFLDRSSRNYELKKRLFGGCKNLTIVSVSEWLKSNVDQSFLKDYPGLVIYNGVDTDIFKPCENDIKKKLGLARKKLLIGVATAWSESKGLLDYYKLADILSDEYQIVLIGLSQKQISSLPSNIIGIARTQNVQELVQYYSAADIVMNLSYAETFGLTTAEGFACGTPSIVYNATASPELITEDTGMIVEPGNIEQVKNAVLQICERGKEYYSANCRKRAVEKFDKKKQFSKYIDLYNQLLEK